MPPKKRGAAKTAATAPANSTRTSSRNVASTVPDISTDAPKRRGRPPKVKPATEEAETELVGDASIEEAAEEINGQEEEATMPKRRGRPPKNITPSRLGAVVATTRSKAEEEAKEPVIPKRRGRPAKDPLPAESEEPVIARKRGRPVKNPLPAKPEEAVLPRKRGRPFKNATPFTVSKNGTTHVGKRRVSAEQTQPIEQDDSEDVVEAEIEPEPIKRGRGRPAKNATSIPQAEPEMGAKARKRGVARHNLNTAEEEVEPIGLVEPVKRKRGRPAAASRANDSIETSGRSKRAKIAAESEEELANSSDENARTESQVPKRKRGRPSTKIPEETSRRKSTKVEDQNSADVLSIVSPPDTDTKKRGRAHLKSSTSQEELTSQKAKNTLKKEAAKASKVAKPVGPAQQMSDKFGRQFWLMKAEPESRIEKGKAITGSGMDVSFSIDDLAAKSEPEPWTGVRNIVASRNMQAMKVGDWAFFYHSNCKTPGIAGIMEIVEEAKADQDAFDPANAYYDAKSSRDSPKWLCTSVEFRKKLPTFISLQTLKEYQDDELKNLELFRLSRLSVSKVSKTDWDFIMNLAGEDPIASPAAAKEEVGTRTEDGPESASPGNLAKQVAKPSGILATVQNFLSPNKPNRATSVGPSNTPSLRTPANTSRRANSAQPSLEPVASLASTAEDPVSGTVPPVFAMRSSSPEGGPKGNSAVKVAAAANDPVMPVEHGVTIIGDGISDAINAAVEGTTDAVNNAIDAFADALDGNTADVSVDEALMEYQDEMETTIM